MNTVRALLKKYGDHLYECRLKHGGDRCNCGFATATEAPSPFSAPMPVAAWAIRNMDGIVLWSSAKTKKACIGYMESFHGDDWPRLRKMFGYRCVKVEIREVEAK